MLWVVLESLMALAIGIAIVWFTVRPRRRRAAAPVKPADDRASDDRA